jgi:GNAT superfamily N-acetyltransferase
LHFESLAGPQWFSRENQPNLKDKSSAGQSLPAEVSASSLLNRVEGEETSMPAATPTAKQGAPTASTDLAVIKTQQQAAWSHTLCLPGGECVMVRPARPGDAENLQSYVRGPFATSRYNRFFGPLRELPPAELARVTDMNGPSRVTLIAEIGGSKPFVIGELRYAVLSDAACEFAISVADDWHRKGLGNLLLGDLQCRVRSLGVESLVGDVLRSNATMLAFAHKAGFDIAPRSDDPRAVRIVKDISAPTGNAL